MCRHGELVIATEMRSNQIEDSRRATEAAHPSWSFCLVLGQMTLEMHHTTQVNAWLVVNIVVCVCGEFVIVLQMS